MTYILLHGMNTGKELPVRIAFDVRTTADFVYLPHIYMLHMKDNRLFSKDTVDKELKANGLKDLSNASIAQILSVAAGLEKSTGIPFIRMDQGVPGIPPVQIGTEAEKRALDSGAAGTYPPLSGIPELKEAASKFIKAFMNIEVSPSSCIPGTGSAMISFAAFTAALQRDPEKDTILFIDPGFPVQKSQLDILGAKWKNFDIYNYRGSKLEQKMEEIMNEGNIAAIIYSTPNNPAWFCLDENEVRTIGKIAEKYDAIAIEDIAYFGMDSRTYYGKPFSDPYPPTAARYTGNFIIMLSASKIFSYAGQRIGIACISDRLFCKTYPALAERYKTAGSFGQTIAESIIYAISAGCSMSAQHGVAAILDAACEGKFDFVEYTRDYAKRAERMKKIFTDNGFHIVYDMDGGKPIGDGFFFTAGYGPMSGGELVKELIYYGISSISISTAGSTQEGIRACVSKMTDSMFPLFEERIAAFRKDHPLI